MNLENIGLHVPTLLLPKPGIDLGLWAVIACDQYTSQANYWQQVEQRVGEHPSTLKLIFPEIYLEQNGQEERIRHINETMLRYLDEGVLVARKPGFILVDRQTCRAKSRKGLVVALDLERYDFGAGSKTLIRATEGTIVERLPPRIKVRENAAIELPHIMVLIDDPGKTVIEPLFDLPLEKVYDFDLMLNGGHIQGYAIDDLSHIAAIALALSRLVSSLENRSEGDGLLYAMGDGNHSFATAKAVWERTQSAAEDKNAVMNHPARYALVELVNLHDEGLEFEAIHRVLFHVSPETVLQAMERYTQETGMGFSRQDCASLEEAKAIAEQSGNRHGIVFLAQGGHGVVTIEHPRFTLEVASLQAFLDEFLKQNPSPLLDYIHGEDAVSALSAKADTIGFILPALSKFHLFKSIEQDGALPRKTFSMGEADEKRFYLECRRITS
ncbi:MAG: DUF1015 domain-containing protein [Methylococcaceae bacterium]|nr:DUF1015 domain-containing protein [Methylococcaceae bacterium]